MVEDPFLIALRALHATRGNPSSRKLSEACERQVSHTTINEALSGKRIPSWPTTRDIILALGGRVEDFAELYRATYPPKQGGEPLPPINHRILAELQAIRQLLEEVLNK